MDEALRAFLPQFESLPLMLSVRLACSSFAILSTARPILLPFISHLLWSLVSLDSFGLIEQELNPRLGNEDALEKATIGEPTAARPTVHSY